jgi:CheY-like chemotaxis protein
MYVDDEPDIREVVSLSLGLLGGFAVHCCESGADALSKMPAVKPDLVLLDVMMPGMDGPSVLTQMRANAALSSIPVMFMTAKAMPDEVARFRALGALGVIAKPFDPMRLAEHVIAGWNEWHVNGR